MVAKWHSRWVEIARTDCEETGRTLFSAVEVGCIEVAGVHYTARRSIRGCFETKNEAGQVAFDHARRHHLGITDTETGSTYDVYPGQVVH